MISRAGTLTGTPTVDTVTITSIDPAIKYILVRLRAGTGTASFSVATNGVTAATPTLGGDDLYHLDAARSEHPVEVGNATSVSVKIIGSAALDYVVSGE